MNETEALDKAIHVAGGVTSLARLIGITQPAVSMWRMRKSKIPPEHCLSIEMITAGLGSVVRCEYLRPDVRWQVLRGSTLPPIPFGMRRPRKAKAEEPAKV